HLEFAFAEAFHKIINEKQKKIAVIKGNGQLEDVFIADFLRTVRESYYIGQFTLDSIEKQQPKETLANRSFFRGRKTSFRPIYYQWWKNDLVTG
ncbi:MAG: GldG family protein, partial [Flavobacterium sp.]|nr:GldG family protein [Flavobacterium sp.]